ncbi:major facilitator transporter, partial [Carboxydothermus islandicus]
MALEAKNEIISPPAITQSLINRVVATSTIGTMIEWYDFFIYGFMATYLAAVYFPKGDPIAQTLTAFMAFAVGLFIRPLGAILFGAMGDRIGRKATFMTAILLMGSATALIGIFPGYAQIGVTASVLVFLMRVIQGLSIGGAWGGAASLVAEYVPQEKRGYYGSWTSAAAPLAVVVANAVILLLNFMLGKEAMAAWGWRIPFILSLILVFVSLYLRWKIEESPVFSGMK